MIRRMLSFLSFAGQTRTSLLKSVSTAAATVGLMLIVGSPSVSAQTNIGSASVGGGSVGATVTVPVANAGTLQSIAVTTQGMPNLDFTATGGGTCATGTAYTTKATCTVAVAFTPRHVGARYGAVVLQDASGTALGTAYLLGMGTGPQSTFLPGTRSTITNPISVGLGLAADGNGDLYLADLVNQSVDKGTLQADGSYRWSTVAKGFSQPSVVAVDGAGNVYLVDSVIGSSLSNETATVYKETLTGSGYTQSTIGSNWSALAGLAVDGAGNVYVTQQAVLSLTSIGLAEVYKEALQPDGSYLQSTVGSGWAAPLGVVADASGNVYVADGLINGLVKETLQPNGSYSRSTIGDGLLLIEGLAVDGTGNIYVTVWGDSILAGSLSTAIYKEALQPDGSYVQASVGSGWQLPTSVAVDGSGNVYATDPGISIGVVKVDLADPPALNFASTRPDTTSADSPQTVTVSNLGAAALQFSSLTYPADFPEATAADNCTAGTRLAAGANCTLSVAFAPGVPLQGNQFVALSESLSLTTNTLNTTATAQTLTVSGVESIQTTATPAISPVGGTFTAIQTVTLSDSTPGAAIYYTTDGSTPTVHSTVYGGAIQVLKTETIQAIAVAPDYLASAMTAAAFTINLPVPNFTVAVAPTSLTLASGQSGSVTVTVTALNAFSDTIYITCTGLPAGWFYSTQILIPPLTGPSPTTLTLYPPLTAANVGRTSRPFIPAGALALGLCCFGFRKRRGLQRFLLLAVFALGLSLLNGCGVAGISLTNPINPTNPAGPYTVTVTASAGTVQKTATFTLTVQ
jgi:hypothetical protein